MDGIPKLSGADVSDDCLEANLMVYDEKDLGGLEWYGKSGVIYAYGVVLVQPFEGES